LSEDSWLSPTVLAKLKGQQDKAAQECVLLLGNSPPERRRDDGPLDTDHQEIGSLRAADPATDHHDTMPADDPDDVIHADDSGPRLSVTLKESSVDEIYALPAAQAEQITGRDPSTTDQSKAPQLPPKATARAAGIPALPDLLDPAMLRTMPAKVAAFMMYEPPERPPWRSETPAQRAHGEAIEDCGSWVGE
jgi:hypothetical protein